MDGRFDLDNAFASMYAHIFIFSFDFTPFELVPETMFPHARNPFVFLLVPLACGITVNFRDRHFYFHVFVFYILFRSPPRGDRCYAARLTANGNVDLADNVSLIP